ncbi:MAG: UDP-3-O-(3-hydroxymyristoyl)glucosamine N-acyltransferase [Planctomycetota bacterium]
MSISLGELAATLHATLVRGDPGARIAGAANLAEAGPQHLAPFTDAQFLPQLQATRAGAVLARSESVAANLPAASALLCVADPEMAFVAALQLLHPGTGEQPGIDPRAVVEPGAELGAGVCVGPYAVIRTGARIGARCWVLAHAVVGRGCVLGADCRLYPHVVLYDGVVLGQRVIVHSGSVLGADGFGYKFRGGQHVKVPQVGSVEISDDVEIGANTCIDRGTLGPTRVGCGTKMDNLVQLGHNVVIGRHCILCGQAALAGSVVVEDYAVLGGQVGVADHVRVGQGAKIGAQTGVGTDIRPGVEVFGPWAQERRLAFKEIAALRRLPALFDRVRELERKLKDGKPQANP